jgi:hypothetical protein
MPENLRMVTSKVNQNNKEKCNGNIDRPHTIDDITYLKEWISRVEKTKAAGEEKYLSE